MNNNIMLKLRYTDTEAVIRLVSRQGKISNIYVDLDELKKFVDEGYADFRDCDDYITASLNNGMVYMRITHVVPYSSGKIEGWRYYVHFPIQKLLYFLDCSESVDCGGWYKILCKDEDSYPVICFHSDHALRNIADDPITRRAFCKAIRNSFKYRNSERIDLWDDGVYDFFFRETRAGGERGICGGLIRHKLTRKGHPCVEYSVHT